MGNGRGQPAGGGELFNLQHAPLYFELFNLAQSSKVAQDGDGIGNLAALAIDLAGTGVVINLLPERGVIKTQRRGFTIRERRRKRVNKRREFGLVLELNSIADNI